MGERTDDGTPRSAVVLGLFYTGLAVVRTLGRAGIPVYGFDADASQHGFRSRYGRHELCPDPVEAPDALSRFLVDSARRCDAPPILYPTTDAFVAFASEYRDTLAPHLVHALPSKHAVATAIDKRDQYLTAQAAGIAIPWTYCPTTLNEVRALAPRLLYPMVVKPAIGHLARRHMHGKAVRVESAAELLAVFAMFDRDRDRRVLPRVHTGNASRDRAVGGNRGAGVRCGPGRCRCYRRGHFGARARDQ